MPEKRTIQRARKAARQGKSPSTQASEFVHEEIKKIRKGAHGARSPKQAIAIGLSQARKAGVKLPPKPGAKAKTAKTRRSQNHLSPKRSKAILKALRREPTSSVSHEKLANQAHESAVRRGPAYITLFQEKLKNITLSSCHGDNNVTLMQQQNSRRFLSQSNVNDPRGSPNLPHRVLS